MNTNNIGSGWIIQNDKGHITLAGSSKQHPLLKLNVWRFYMLYKGYHQVVMEGDCKLLLDIFYNLIVDVVMENVVKDICSWTNHFTDIKFFGSFT